jgi:hypothetical protein
MIQVIASNVRPSSPALVRRFLANPDVLLQVGDDDGDSPAAADTFSLVLHDLRMGGTWKKTRRGRLKETERVLCAELKGRTSISFLDLGASDGVTTWEAVQSLREVLGGDVSAWLADVNLYLYRYRKGPVVEYRAGDGEPIMARIGRLGLRLSKHRAALRQSPDPLVTLYLRLEALRRRMTLDTRIPLIHPLARAERAITPIEMNCQERQDNLNDSVDAVRASNVLNHGYFTPDQIRIALSHLHAYLRDGGCLVVSRNIDVAGKELECGTVWRKNGCLFERVDDFGRGSEVREIVDEWRAATAITDRVLPSL